MADNVAITAGTGTSIATDDVGGVQYQRVKVTHGADGVATDVSTASPLPVGQYDADLGLYVGMNALRDLQVAQRYTVLSDSVADGLASFWTQTVTDGGSVVVAVGEGLLQTSTATTGAAQLVSTPVIYYPGQVTWFNSAIRLGDTGSAGNIRRWGAFTVIGTTPWDGYYYELNGTTLNAVSVKAGTATAVASTSWTKVATNPFTLDTSYHQFEIRYTANSVQFFIDNTIRHSASGGTSSITQTLNFSIAIQTINSSGATERTIAVRNVGIGRFGTPELVKTTASAVDGAGIEPAPDLIAGWDGRNVRAAHIQAVDGRNVMVTEDHQNRRLLEELLIESRTTNSLLARLLGPQAPSQRDLEPGQRLVS